ncbi:MAG TPA: hypothetical protein VGZ00_07245 [Candidatus Baltobacteraceae bacterium]|nr:hypothetical protein [Candidatus Baltobacteraceae bacterium]
MRLAITCNGPGEFAGWVRPLAYALYARDPELDLSLIFTPDDYASGREADLARTLFPQAHVVNPSAYVRFALGGDRAGLPDRVDAVLLLGGDLMHAARVHARLGGRLYSYKFASHRFAKRLVRVFAVDEKNVEAVKRCGVTAEKIEWIGNLAIDGALGEAEGRFVSCASSPAIPEGGLLIMPGVRRAEIANLVSFFLQTAVRLRTILPDLPIAFGIAPFTTREQLERALEGGGDWRMWGARGRVVSSSGGEAIESLTHEGMRFPIVRDAMRVARAAACVLTIPGTKCIELAALGVPAVVCIPTNAPELVAINGPLTYLDRIPKIGPVLKRAIVLRYAAHFEARFRYFAQPNIDAGAMLMPELRGTLTPGYVAARVAEYLADDVARTLAAHRLRALYADHVGASERLARSLMESLS